MKATQMNENEDQSSKISTDATIGALIEQQRFSATQILVVALVSAVLVLDGLNLQLLAYSLPAILTEWGVTKVQLSSAVGMTMIGMAIGALFGGSLGDRWGRRPALLATIALFAAMTLACGLAQNVTQLTVLRLLSGLGFGACFPSAAALVAEWVPRRRIGLAVGIITVGVPLGGMAGAMLTVLILPHWGWRGCFFAGGMLPVLIGLAAFVLMPESPAWLSRRGEPGRPDLERLARRAWGWTQPLAIDTPAPRPNGAQRSAGDRLLARANARVNIGLWLAFFTNMLVANAILAWGTAALSQLNMPLASAVSAAIPYNIASMAMAVLASILSVRLGSRGLLIGLALTGAAGSICAAIFSPMVASGAMSPLPVLAGYIVIGGAMGGIQALLFALAAHAYSTAYRSSGVGVGSAVGRIGGIVSGFGGGAILSVSSTAPFFGLAGFCLLLVAAGAIVIDRHIQPR